MKVEGHFSPHSIQDEFRIWTQFAKPKLNLPGNVLCICEYGFTEVLNNAFDHSQSDHVAIRCEQDTRFSHFEIEDDGVGLFAKLREYFDLDSDIHALIELVKGKLTAAPQAHSGEGLFFSSKMFDRFLIEAGELSVLFEGDRCSVRSTPNRKGTLIRMEIANDSHTTVEQIFGRFCDAEELTFYKTRFLLSLAAFEGSLISRSQAKRVAARLENFGEVELDFFGVEHIGQAFADELFRVWPMSHPQTQLQVLNANEAILRMASHIRGRTDLPQPARP
jgi:anti-sigma regulatory factor (Ser/Thr protein kinase)